MVMVKVLVMAMVMIIWIDITAHLVAFSISFIPQQRLASHALSGDVVSSLAKSPIAHATQGLSAMPALDQGMRPRGLRLPPPSACKQNVIFVVFLRFMPILISQQGWVDDAFLVFRFWAGLCNRRIELQNMVALAKLLNRTLVILLNVFVCGGGASDCGFLFGVWIYQRVNFICFVRCFRP
jgi:hypothetical protein